MFNLRKQPALKFSDPTTGFPAKWRLSNDWRNSILMTSNCPDLASASDQWCREENLLQSIRTVFQFHHHHCHRHHYHYYYYQLKAQTYLPLRPARAVLPTLWIYCFIVGGRLALITCQHKKDLFHLFRRRPRGNTWVCEHLKICNTVLACTKFLVSIASRA